MITSIAMIFWIILCVPIVLLPFLKVEQTILFNYSLIAQIIAPFVSAGCCYMTSFVFPKKDAMRKVWSLLGAGVLCWGVGAMLFAAYPFLYGGEETPYPWYADVGYLLLAPCVITAFFIFKRNLHIEVPLWGWISAIAFFAAAFTLYVVFNLNKLAESESFISYTVTILYTVADPLLLGGTVITASLLAGGAVARPWWLVLMGLVFYYMADLIYTYLTITDQYATGHIIDLGWLIGFGCIAIAALMTRSLFKEF